MSRADYISSKSQFSSDSIPARLDYERSFLEHRARLADPGRARVDSWNDRVFDAETGLRRQLARNHTVNPLREIRAAEVARANAALVSRLKAIAFTKSSAGALAQAVREGGVRGAALSGLAAHKARQGSGGNDRVRAAERARIEHDNLCMAARLLHNRSELEAAAFAKHVAQHNYLLRNKSRLRAIKMKSSTPGASLHGGLSPRARTAHSAPRRRTSTTTAATGGVAAAAASFSAEAQQQQQDEAEEYIAQAQELQQQVQQHQQMQEYEFAMQAYNSFFLQQQQQQQLQQTAESGGDNGGAMPFLPPIHPSTNATSPASVAADLGYDGPSDAELLNSGGPEPWLEAHEDDLARMKAETAHVPRVRQSHKEHPREALHLPLRRHFHRAETHEAEVRRRERVAQAFANLQSTLVVPRTRLDQRTGGYQLEWVELAEDGAEEERGSQGPDDDGDGSSGGQQHHQQQDAALAYQQHMAALYASFLAQQQQQHEQGPPGTAPAAFSPSEAKEDSDSSAAASSFWPQPPSAASGAAAPTHLTPAFSADGTPHAPAVWPFGGTIVPPQLRPPPPAAAAAPSVFPFPPMMMPMPPQPPSNAASTGGAAVQSARSRRDKHVRAAHAAGSSATAQSARRGRLGKQIFPLRQKPNSPGRRATAAAAPSSATASAAVAAPAPRSASVAAPERDDGHDDVEQRPHQMHPADSSGAEDASGDAEEGDSSAANDSSLPWQTHAAHAATVAHFGATLQSRSPERQKSSGGGVLSRLAPAPPVPEEELHPPAPSASSTSSSPKKGAINRQGSKKTNKPSSALVAAQPAATVPTSQKKLADAPATPASDGAEAKEDGAEDDGEKDGDTDARTIPAAAVKSSSTASLHSSASAASVKSTDALATVVKAESDSRRPAAPADADEVEEQLSPVEAAPASAAAEATATATAKSSANSSNRSSAAKLPDATTAAAPAASASALTSDEGEAVQKCPFVSDAKFSDSHPLSIAYSSIVPPAGLAPSSPDAAVVAPAAATAAQQQSGDAAKSEPALPASPVATPAAVTVDAAPTAAKEAEQQKLKDSDADALALSVDGLDDLNHDNTNDAAPKTASTSQTIAPVSVAASTSKLAAEGTPAPAKPSAVASDAPAAAASAPAPAAAPAPAIPVATSSAAATVPVKAAVVVREDSSSMNFDLPEDVDLGDL